jgi:hypothetical protein
MALMLIVRNWRVLIKTITAWIGANLTRRSALVW